MTEKKIIEKHVEEFFHDGIKQCEIEMLGEQKHGKMTMYHANGAISVIMNYKEDTQDGITQSYYIGGVLQSQSCYINGVIDGMRIEYDEFGDKIREMTYLCGQPHGEAIIYYPKKTGGIARKEIYKNSVLEGEVFAYYPSGEILSITPYEGGNPQKYPVFYTKKGEIMQL